MSNSKSDSITEQLEGFATTVVPTSVSVSGLRIGLVNGALAFAVPGLITGLEIGGALGFQQSLVAFAAGGALLTVLGIITGLVGYKNRLTSCMTINCVFGNTGASLINLLIALSLLGWYGVNMDLFSAVVNQLLQNWLQVSGNVAVIEITTGIAITGVALFGFGLMQRLSSWLVPVMILLIFYLAANLGDFTIDSPPLANVATLSMSEAISVVVGSFIVGVVLMPDFTRFAADSKGVVVASALPFFALASFVYVVSAAAGLLVRSADAIEVLLLLGLGSMAFALIVVSAFLTNVVNLYSAGLSINAVFRRAKNWQIVFFAGLLGTVLASLNILERFTDFLFSLAIIFAPIAGVYVVDYFVVRKMQNYALAESHSSMRSKHWLAVVSWLAGLGISLLAQAGTLSLSGLASIDGLFSAMALYALLSKFLPKDTTE